MMSGPGEWGAVRSRKKVRSLSMFLFGVVSPLVYMSDAAACMLARVLPAPTY